MKQELENKFYERFKFIKKGKTPQDWFFFGFECGDGWFDLLWDLCLKLEELKFEGKVQQVKEKFGGLRFYVDGATDEQWKVIEEAEAKSYKTCETCGQSGKVGGKGWIATLCDICRNKKE